MNIQQQRIQETLTELHNDAKFDFIKMMQGAAKSVFRPLQPQDFKNVYLSISKEQGEDLRQMIVKNNLRNMIEFGTSFGISTLSLAQGALETDGHIITTELVESKAIKAVENFKNAGVNELIEVRTGDALETLKDHENPIDLLLLDGWKNLYLPLFDMLEENFHTNTIVYVDNADMADTQEFLKVVSQRSKYKLTPRFGGKVVLITIKS